MRLHEWLGLLSIPAKGPTIRNERPITPNDQSDKPTKGIPDYYEFLQISVNADPETIQRVYRFLAARFHPDNPETGDDERFFLLTQAYAVLSSPERRAEYDAKRKNETVLPEPLSSTIDFMDNAKGELNRRLAVLSVLYFQRRANPYSPDISFVEIEERLGFPREYLEFTAWYLKSKGYITRTDSSDFTLTAEGVDFVETQRVNIPVLNKLLTTGSGLSSRVGRQSNTTSVQSPQAIPIPASSTPTNDYKEAFPGNENPQSS